MKIELRKVKGHDGPDSFCFVADLYVDGKKQCQVSDDGHGGSIHFDDLRVCDQLNIYANSLPEISFGDGMDGTFKQDADWLVRDALDTYLENKQLKKACTKKTLFRLVGDEAGNWYTIKEPYSPSVESYIKKTYGNKLEEIANDRFRRAT